jgi:hypothetical protein
VERNDHPTPEQGGGQNTGETGRKASTELPADAPAPDTGAPAARPGADVIMSRLPRTRPQLATGRRQRNPQGAAAPQPAAAPARAQRAAGGRAGAPPKASTSGSTARAAKQAKSVAATRATSAGRAKRTATARPRPAATPAPAARSAPRRPSPPPRPVGGNGAASLPRLAVDGAVEAAKLPLKVGGRLTLRALDAVARGLRGG